MDRSSTALLLSLIAHALVAWWLLAHPAETPPERPTEVTYNDPERPRARDKFIDHNPAKPDEHVVKDQDVKDELHDASALISNLNRRYKKQKIVPRFGPDLNSPVSAPTVPPKDAPQPESRRGETPETRRGELELPRGGPLGRKEPLFSPSSATKARVPWVDFGDVTVLNSDRNTYYVFYERMNEQVGNRWVGLVYEMVARTPRERLEKMSLADRRTRVEIILDANGDFKEARFEEKSGFQDLDYTGVEAFRMATPFVNPPRGMVGPDGLIHVHVAFTVIMRPPMLAPSF